MRPAAPQAQTCANFFLRAAACAVVGLCAMLWVGCAQTKATWDSSVDAVRSHSVAGFGFVTVDGKVYGPMFVGWRKAEPKPEEVKLPALEQK